MNPPAAFRAILSDPERLAAFLREVPDTLIASEWGRRRGAKTINRRGGGIWSHHVPGYSRCQCVDCHKARKGH